ncbi:iron complex transport system permease protein [Halopolyspora algeriensis]|uniref:Iron complex transport system permease protein n=1 Tax=Halopolyspora algeriensis TaxID=1500506 RepID=A0A368VH30_9ACTN|nr:iron complex transport system permease protein [Halopolyspora algeriensis]TQM46606.1 iron complex transport system permease protein [Halopolyspora algeriensis]
MLVGSVLLLGAAVLAGLALGSNPIPLPEVIAALSGGGDAYTRTVVESRIPRTLQGLLVGACLALSGVLVQGITRNPLGDPGLLGVNIGASASVVTATAFFGLGGHATIWAALPGAFLAVGVVSLIGSGRGGATPVRLVLAGAVVSAVLSAYIQAMTLSLPDVFGSYRYWVVGSLAGGDTDTLLGVLPFAVAGLVLAVLMAAPLNALALGDTTAATLGANTTAIRIGGMLSATLLCAAATASAGPIAFIGLAVPHIVRALVGNDHRWQVPLGLVLGPVLLLTADVLGRVIARPQEIMVGVVTAFVGAPALLLAVRRMRAGT